MTHCQMFKAFDNDDGYISVICHRERYAKDLRKMGFVDSLEDAKAKPEPSKTISRRKSKDDDSVNTGK